MLQPNGDYDETSSTSDGSIFACVFAVPAWSQAMVEYPAACAQFYPDANCENYGRGNPYTAGYASREFGTAHASMATLTRHTPFKKHHLR
jgi:hypothetical protein